MRFAGPRVDTPRINSLTASIFSAHRSSERERQNIFKNTFSAFRELLKDDCSFYVPEVVDNLSTKRVLTTEYVDGSSLDKIADWDKSIINKVGGKSVMILHDYTRCWIISKRYKLVFFNLNGNRTRVEIQNRNN